MQSINKPMTHGRPIKPKQSKRNGSVVQGIQKTLKKTIPTYQSTLTHVCSEVSAPLTFFNGSCTSSPAHMWAYTKTGANASHSFTLLDAYGVAYIGTFREVTYHMKPSQLEHQHLAPRHHSADIVFLFGREIAGVIKCTHTIYPAHYTLPYYRLGDLTFDLTPLQLVFKKRRHIYLDITGGFFSEFTGCKLYSRLECAHVFPSHQSVSAPLVSDADSVKQLPCKV